MELKKVYIGYDCLLISFRMNINKAKRDFVIIIYDTSEIFNFLWHW